ncbi:MAG: phosphate butyryltransferase [Spirochaetaceae bacterium]
MTSFEEVFREAQSYGPRTLSVACSHDADVLHSVSEAMETGIVDALLFGDAEKTKSIAAEEGLDIGSASIVDVKDPVEAAQRAVQAVSAADADVLMKGLVDTSVLMKQALNADYGLRTGKVLSHVAVFRVPEYPRLLIGTDAAINIAPELEQKRQIVENACGFAQAIGIPTPKIALLCAKEKVDPKMPCTEEAARLVEMNESGEIRGCTVGGPFALDNAVSLEAAKHKGIVHPVAGRADVLVAPDIEAGNILYKSLVFLGGAKSAALVVGARAPIVLTSRADSSETKLNSIALAVLQAAAAAESARAGVV